MNKSRPMDMSRFFVVGINYRKSEDSVRSQFAISNEQYAQILSLAPAAQLRELFVLSTCNRTEVYGLADDPLQLMELLCTQTVGNVDLFREMAYIHRGPRAVNHFFEVAAGLDSQILGDYEIVGQIRLAVRFAREQGFIHSFLDRLTNQVLQASKTIKNQTALSGGTVSVSFAAVQYIREYLTGIEEKNILLFGVGKIGRNTCKNLKDYLNTDRITLINRSPEKAIELAAELGLSYESIEQAPGAISSADVIIVATNAAEPVVRREHLNADSRKLIIDLSIPYNVEPAVADYTGVKLVTIDELSRMKDETLQKRQAEVPKARAIIAEHFTEFIEWYDMRKQVVVLKAIKSKLEEIHSCPLFGPLVPEQSAPFEENIQRVITGMATKMRRQNQPGCHYIEALNDFMAAQAN